MTPSEYRNKHRRCEFCKYLRYRGASGWDQEYLFVCTAKSKEILFPFGLSRRFCKCFELKENDNECKN